MGVYFGNLEYQTEIPAPLSQAGADKVGYSSLIALENGGAVVGDSFAAHHEYNLSWIGDPDKLAIIREFKQGIYGPGPFYWVNPLAASRNLFAPNWASPRVIATGDWKDIYDKRFTRVDVTPENIYGNPRRTVVYDLGAAAAREVPKRKFTILIPPGQALYFGVTGTRTGTGVIGARAVLADGSFTPVTLYPTLPADEAARYISLGEFSYAAGHRAVQIFLTANAAGAGTVGVTSAVARLVPQNGTPGLETRFRSGEGATGLRFQGDVKESIYWVGGMNQPAKIGMSVKLVETESWEL